MLKSYESNNFAKYVVDFYWKNIAQYDYHNCVDILISDDIMVDYKLYKNKPLTKNIAGITLLPIAHDENITIIISEDEIQKIIYLIHELTHACDIIEFSNFYCKSKLYNVESHYLYQTFVYWSEFHVKLFDIIYTHIIAYLPKYNTIKGAYTDFVNQIPTLYYPTITKKILNKINNNDVNIRDIMYYLGELTTCNSHDPDNTYILNDIVVAKYPLVESLYKCLSNAQNFSTFVEHVEILDYLYNN